MHFRFTQEVMRWGPKADDVHKTLSGQNLRLMDWIGTAGTKSEVLRRLSEVAAQQNLMTKFPDQYWAYRSQVREHLTHEPRSKIRQVNFENHGAMDPEDRRRLAYFPSLGRAAKRKRVEDIRRVAEFETPFDPLLSYFLHAEIAELYTRAKHPDPEQELRHRMHVAYYSSPIDTSVHNIIDAIELQTEHPESAPQAEQRWDQLNSLLQLLKTRWDVRSTRPPGIPKNVLRDVELSLVAAEKAIDRLDGFTAEAGVSRADWQSRREVLERGLVRPLRSYRTKLIPHVGRERILDDSGERGPAPATVHTP